MGNENGSKCIPYETATTNRKITEIRKRDINDRKGQKCNKEKGAKSKQAFIY